MIGQNIALWDSDNTFFAYLLVYSAVSRRLPRLSKQLVADLDSFCEKSMMIKKRGEVIPHLLSIYFIAWISRIVHFHCELFPI